MNIVTPVPTSLVFTTANVSTEAARRENLLKDTIPPSKDAEQSASEQGLGSESDRAKTPGQKPAPVTYERPQIQVDARPEVLQNEGENQGSDTDNGNKESAGKESAEEKQQQQAQQKEIESLEKRDQEVRQHEQAHAAAGGQYAGSPKYEYDTGPDGKRYVTDGEVSIDVSEAESPEQTVRKMEQVRAAALAPAEPSSQDLKVAAEANRKAIEARAELSSNDEISGADASVSASGNDFSVEGTGARQLDIQDEVYQNRIGVIQQFYQAQVSPKDGGFTAFA